MPTKLAHALPWLILAIIVASTLSPIQLRPHSILHPQIERFLAFALLGGSFALAYPRHWLLILVGLCCGAYVLEMAQLLTSDRHFGYKDMVAKVAGTSIGLGTGLFVARLLPQPKPSA